MKSMLVTVPLELGKHKKKNVMILPKIAIVCLVTWMQRFGFTEDEWCYYDIDILEDSDVKIAEKFSSETVDVLGISAVTSASYTAAKKIAKIFRAVHPDSWIVLGGYLANSAATILSKTEVDICVVGDGEYPWVDFLNYVKRNGKKWKYEELGKIRGIAYFNSSNDMIFTGYADRIPGHLQPFPDYDILKSGFYNRSDCFDMYIPPFQYVDTLRFDNRCYEPGRKQRAAAIWTTKGCIAMCTFCQRTTKGHLKCDIERLDNYLKDIVDKYDVGFIQVVDENFAADIKHARQAAVVLKKYNLLWHISGIRCPDVTKDDLAFFKSCGCTGVQYGFESGSQRIMDIMEKRFTVNDIKTAVEHTLDLGLTTRLGLAIGMPGESKETIKQSAELVAHLCKYGNRSPKQLGVASQFVLAMPGTPLYEYGQQNGLIGKTIDEEEKYLLNISDRPASKYNHSNFCGAKFKELIFWDFEVFYWAIKKYYESYSIQDILKKFCIEIIKKLNGTYREWKNPTRPLFYDNALFSKIPWKLICFIGENIVFSKYCLSSYLQRIKNIFSGENYSMTIQYKNLKTRVKPIEDSFFNRDGSPLDRSLRRIVEEGRKPPMTVTERNHQILVNGS